MAAGTYNISIEQGATFTRTIQVNESDGTTPKDLTGATATAKIKRTWTDTEVIATITCAIPSPTNGQIDLSLTDAQTAVLPVQPTLGAAHSTTVYVWKLSLTEGDGTVTRLLQGTCEVVP